jgi:hypothetical protein
MQGLSWEDENRSSRQEIPLPSCNSKSITMLINACRLILSLVSLILSTASRHISFVSLLVLSHLFIGLPRLSPLQVFRLHFCKNLVSQSCSTYRILLVFITKVYPNIRWTLSIYPWLYSPCGPWPLFQFLNLYTVGRTPWTGDQPVARPLPTHRTTQTE